MGVKRFAGRWKSSFSPIFCQKCGYKFLFSYSKEDTVIALAFIMYDDSLTNNLLVVILFHKWAIHIF